MVFGSSGKLHLRFEKIPLNSCGHCSLGGKVPVWPAMSRIDAPNEGGYPKNTVEFRRDATKVKAEKSVVEDDRTCHSCEIQDYGKRITHLARVLEECAHIVHGTPIEQRHRRVFSRRHA